MARNCEVDGCTNQINEMDPKRVYLFDEVIEDEIPVMVCDKHYQDHIKEDNDIDWAHSVDETSDAK